MSKGLSPEQRKAMLDEETGDGDGEVVLTDPPATPPVSPIAEPPAPPPPSSPSDMQSLIAALVTGIAQANQGTAIAIKEALGTAAVMARDPIPENKTIAGHSVYSHPDGEAANTKLRCPMFMGIYDEEGKCRAALEIFGDTCTEVERVALNKLVPGVYPGMDRNDGVKATWRVVQHADDNGVTTRLIIAVPQQWLSQEQFMQMPGQPNFLAQLNAAKQAAAA